jgi:hypothetical protein
MNPVVPCVAPNKPEVPNPALGTPPPPKPYLISSFLAAYIPNVDG